jgi:hypothetical protein
MNVPYDQFNHEMVEKYFQRSLAYGIFPGMFSHNAADAPYWQNPAWYDRDRDLFKRYIPIVKRVAEAGWQPVTAMHCDNPLVRVERFGPGGSELYFTVHTTAASAQAFSLEPDGSLRLVNGPLRDLVSGQSFDRAGKGWRGTIQPDQTLVLQGKME